MNAALRFMLAAAVVFVARSYPSLSITNALAALFLCAALGAVAVRSTAAGSALVAILTGLCFIPTAFINITEAVLFDLVDVTAAPVALARDLGVAITAGTAVAAVVGRLRTPAAPVDALTPAPTPVHSVPSLLWRLAAAAAVFVLCYFVVGAAIYPLVRDYYGGRPIPPVESIVSMQVLRGVALVAAMYPAIRTIPSRRTSQWLFAAVLPVLGAVVPLLPENTVMPLPMRVVHGVEIASYYTLYGFLVATWFSARRRPSERPIGRVAPVPH